MAQDLVGVGKVELKPGWFMMKERIGMSEHKANLSWKRTSSEFLSGKYSREHTWTFDGGLTVPASPSPSVVPVPYSNPAHIDPEEAFVASPLKGCIPATAVVEKTFNRIPMSRLQNGPKSTLCQ